MCSRSNTKACAFLLGAAVMLAGCSDIYYDRRDTISPSAGDAIAVNRVTHMVDPWPRSSANRNIAFNGEVMQRAVERYRDGDVIPPVNNTTSAAYARIQQQRNNNGQARATTSTPAQAQAPGGWASSSQQQ
jgi:hypothetical protein